MNVRRGRSLLLSFHGPSLTATNFLYTNAVVVLDDVSIEILVLASDWIPVAALYDHFRWRYHPFFVQNLLAVLLDRGILVAENTEGARKDVAFEARFEWGLVAGYYHFSIKNPTYMTPEQMSQWLTHRVATRPPVPLYTTNERYKEVVELPRASGDGVFQAMRERRSYRGFGSEPITLAQLADCLFAGFGITHFAGTLTPGEGKLPLSMTPSAGARNPYEGFVYARRVQGLNSGIYHYSAVDHTIGFVTAADVAVGELLANQPWFDNAAAVVILVANFGRTSWKYPHPTGYRVVLIEAGHIAQNIALAATAHGLASAPTCAVSDALIEQLLDLDGIDSSAIYTVSLGVRSPIPTQADAINIEPNPFLSEDER